jgi:hypothetical protein
VLLADGRKVWACRHHHPTTGAARACATQERRLPGSADLGLRLRELRVAAGLTIGQVANHLECSEAKLSRVETGRVQAAPRDVRDMLALYRVADPERQRLIQAARGARRQDRR